MFGPRKPARQKRGIIGWVDLPTGPVACVRRRKKWLLLGGLQVEEAVLEALIAAPKADLVTAEAPRGYGPQPSECSGPGFGGPTD